MEDYLDSIIINASFFDPPLSLKKKLYRVEFETLQKTCKGLSDNKCLQELLMSGRCEPGCIEVHNEFYISVYCKKDGPDNNHFVFVCGSRYATKDFTTSEVYADIDCGCYKKYEQPLE